MNKLGLDKWVCPHNLRTMNFAKLCTATRFVNLFLQRCQFLRSTVHRVAEWLSIYRYECKYSNGHKSINTQAMLKLNHSLELPFKYLFIKYSNFFIASLVLGLRPFYHFILFPVKGQSLRNTVYSFIKIAVFSWKRLKMAIYKFHIPNLEFS